MFWAFSFVIGIISLHLPIVRNLVEMAPQIFFIRRPLFLACSQGSIFSMKLFHKSLLRALFKRPFEN